MGFLAKRHGTYLDRDGVEQEERAEGVVSASMILSSSVKESNQSSP